MCRWPRLRSEPRDDRMPPSQSISFDTQGCQQFSGRRRRRPGCSWGCARGPTPCTRSAGPSPGPPGPDPAPTPAGLTTRRDRRVFCGVTRVPWSTYFASFSRSRAAFAALRSISKFVAVKTDPDVLDILGGAVEVVDEERSGDGGHVDQGTRMASATPVGLIVVSGRCLSAGDPSSAGVDGIVHPGDAPIRGTRR